MKRMIEYTRMLGGRIRRFGGWNVKCGGVFVIVAFMALAAQKACAVEPDIVLADFEGPDYKGWQSTGDAFGIGPAQEHAAAKAGDWFSGAWIGEYLS